MFMTVFFLTLSIYHGCFVIMSYGLKSTQLSAHCSVFSNIVIVLITWLLGTKLSLFRMTGLTNCYQLLMTAGMGDP